MESTAFQELIITKGLYKRLQEYAVPLEDSIETVITKLCDWRDEQLAKERQSPTAISGTDYWAQLLSDAYSANDPVGASLARERIRNAYFEHLLASIRIRRDGRTKNPYELQVDAGTAAELREAGVADLFETARKVYLPVGAQLMGEYQQNRFFASIQAGGIEFHGTLYDNPSKAAVAAKLMFGATPQQAQTNGWQFWKIELPPNSNTWESIDSLRVAQLNQLARD